MTAYRNELDALTARRDALAAEVAAKTRELDDATRMVNEVERKARLPVLDNIRVASPCKADWAAMTGDERVRHCGACDKDVFNLSAMTRDEAQALITEKAGKLCARYYQRADGTILLADCTVGAKQQRGRRLIAAGAAALLAGAAGVTAYARATGHEASPPGTVMGGIGRVSPPTEVMMGEMEMVPPVEAVETAVETVERGAARAPGERHGEVKGDISFGDE